MDRTKTNLISNKILPSNSIRRMFASLLLNTVRNPIGFKKSFNAKNLRLFFRYLKTGEYEILEEMIK